MTIQNEVQQQFSSLPHTHTRRSMKEYVVTEAELDELSLLNTLASGFFSAASASFLFAVGLFTSALIQGTLSEKASAFVLLGEWVGFILGTVFFIIGLLSCKKKKSKLSSIKNQAIEIDQVSSLNISQTRPITSQNTPPSSSIQPQP